MKIAYILNACSTCQRILKEVDWQYDVQNIKEKQIDEQTLDLLAEKHGGYSALFSKRAMKYRALGLHEKDLSEKEMKNWILKEYTFLKRPVFIIDEASFVGNSKKTVEALKAYLTAQ